MSLFCANATALPSIFIFSAGQGIHIDCTAIYNYIFIFSAGQGVHSAADYRLSQDCTAIYNYIFIFSARQGVHSAADYRLSFPATALPSIIIFSYFQLDKASIVRLTIAYLRLRDFANHGDPPWNRDGRFDGKATLKSKDFLYVLRDYKIYSMF